MDRVDQGLKPACVTVCTTHCLSFGTAEEIPPARRKRYAKAMAAFE
jgi:Fe-S-cluster-containing dehydrogenase component